MAKTKRLTQLQLKELDWRLDPAQISSATTADVPPLRKVIGQDRALRALHMGLRISSQGYNVFVCGMEGTGRSSIIASLLEKHARALPAPPDKIYVHNFRDPDQPQLLILPAGQGKQFQEDVRRLLKRLSKSIPELFNKRHYRESRDELFQKYQERESRIIRQFESRVQSEGFALVEYKTDEGVTPDLLPYIEGQPRTFEELEDLAANQSVSRETMAKYQDAYPHLKRRLDDAFAKVLQIRRQMSDEMQKLENHLAKPLIQQLIGELKEKYQLPETRRHLDMMEHELLESLDLFKLDEELALEPVHGLQHDPWRKFMVNVLVDNSALRNAPVVVETVPTFKNLFGAIDKTFDASGQPLSDFLDIRAGSIARADGGYLAFNLSDAFTERGVWKHLKRTLKNKQLEIEVPEGVLPGPGMGMKPMAIPVNLKVVLIGTRDLYDLLQCSDEDFRKIFKVKAEFEETARFARRHITQYARFIAKLCENERLLPFDRSALAALIDYAVRIAGWRKRISVQLGRIADLAREASFWAVEDGVATVTADYVQRARDEQLLRVRLDEEHLLEAIEDEFVLISTRGAEVGMVNGLSVFESGDYEFGLPCRITASVGVGRSGIVNIEREARLSGRVHDKGVLILAGYLRSLFGSDHPFSISASVCFEQSYMPVDGDSASVAEAVALLSVLANLPVRQDLAVTGSLNQFGHVQAIGGINQKVEGFFRVCQARGLTGAQGVILPAANVPNLVLDPDVLAAVEKGKFHLYRVTDITEAIALLLRRPAGIKGKSGKYTPGSVFARADRRAQQLTRLASRARPAAGSKQRSAEPEDPPAPTE